MILALFIIFSFILALISAFAFNIDDFEDLVRKETENLLELDFFMELNKNFLTALAMYNIHIDKFKEILIFFFLWFGANIYMILFPFYIIYIKIKNFRKKK